MVFDRNQKEINKLSKKIELAQPLVNYSNLSRRIYEATGDLKTDLIIAHGAEALCLAFPVARRLEATIICDCVDVPEMHERTVERQWHPVNLEFINATSIGFLSQCDGILTVGWTLGRLLEKYQVPVHVVPNYRYFSSPDQNYDIFKKCGISKNKKIIVAINTIGPRSKFENIIYSLPQIPNEYHLVVVGEFKPRAYSDVVHDLVKSVGVEDRFHVVGMVPYDSLVNLLSGAYLGLIVLNPEIGTHKVCLPNRLFDLLAAGLPIVSPEVADIQRVVDEYGVGKILTDLHPNSWAEGISAVSARIDDYESACRHSLDELCWEKVEPQFLSAIGDAKSITFIARKNLIENQRTLRMCKTLLTNGIDVNVVVKKSKQRGEFINSSEVKIISV